MIHPARDEHHVANLQRSDDGFVERRRERHFACRFARSLPDRSSESIGLTGIAIEPLANRAVPRVRGAHRAGGYAQQSYATETKKLAGSRLSTPTLQPIRLTLPPNPIVPIPSELTVPMIDGFELGQPRVRIHVVERPEELLFGVQVAGRPIAADADTDGAGAASLALRLPDRVKDALAHAFERAIGAAEMREFGGQRVLDVHVLAAAAFEHAASLRSRHAPTDRNE